MILPLIKALKSLGGSANIGELDAETIAQMRLSDDVCGVLHKGKITEVSYRLAWARTYLKKFGLIGNSNRGVWSFNDKFDGDIDKITPNDVVQKVRSKYNAKQENFDDNDLENDGIELPDEVRNLSWHEKLKNILINIKPDAFERLTLRLLRESGFTHVEVTGKTNDHGIDGVGRIRLNGIMSFNMLFQCKRYKDSVGSGAVRDFRGAMQGRTDKGLLITTGVFTEEAKKEAVRDGAPAIDLIDGDALVEMLRELGLGVTEKIIKDYEIDEEWFKKI